MIQYGDLQIQKPIVRARGVQFQKMVPTLPPHPEVQVMFARQRRKLPVNPEILAQNRLQRRL